MTIAERFAILALLTAGGLAGGAQVLEHGVGLDPCPLCVMQRLWVLIAGLVVVVALADTVSRGIYPLLVILSAVIGGGFSVRQLYLQSLPADEVPACGPDLAYMIDAFPFADVLSAMTFGTGNCAEVGWTPLGLSLAAWALVGFTAMVVLATLWWRAARTPA